METKELTTIDRPSTELTRVGHEDLLRSFFSNKSEQTIIAYRQDMEDFRKFVGAHALNAAADLLLANGPGHANLLALDYRAHLIESGKAANTVNRKLASLRSLVKLARTLGVVMWRLEIPNLKVEQYRDTTGPTVRGVKGMMAVASCIKNQKKALRDTAIIRLLYDLALRRGEVVSLDLCHLDIENSRISVMGKGRVQREWLTLPAQTLDAILEWLDARGDNDGPLFTSLDRAKKGDGRLTGKSIYHIVNKLGKQIGIKTRPHGLRHTAITEAVKKAQLGGMGLEEVLDFSRHKSVEVLMVYRDRERNVQGQLANMVADSV